VTVGCHVDSVGTVHVCPPSSLEFRIRGYEDGEVRAFACGCTPVLNRFLCPVCERWVGWCMGCSDELPEVCDDCWRDDELPKR